MGGTITEILPYESVKEIIECASNHDVKCLFILAQTPAADIGKSLQESWQGGLFDITNPNYTSYGPKEQEIALIQTEIYILSSIKYHCLACNRVVSIPYPLRSIIIIYNANTILPSRPGCILVPRHTAYLSSLVDKSISDSSRLSLLDHSRKQPPAGTSATALTNLLTIKIRHDLSC